MRLALMITVLVSTILSKPTTNENEENNNLTLERIDAISDLSAIAEKYFAEEFEWERGADLSSQITTSMIFSLSELWKESGSTAYTLTRLAQLIDEKDEEGKLSLKARVIRVLAERSNDRKVYMTTTMEEEERDSGSGSGGVGEVDDESEELGRYRNDVKRETAKYKSSQIPSTELAREAYLIEIMYRRGSVKEADEKVKRWIRSRWIYREEEKEQGKGLITAFTDINESGTRGHYLLLSAFIRLGRDESKLLDFTPEAKAAIVVNLLKLPNFKIAPSTLKWLITVDTYKEDQIKLLRLIEHGLDKGQFMKNNYDSLPGHGAGADNRNLNNNNNILEMFEELWRIDEMNVELQKMAKDKSIVANEEDKTRESKGQNVLMKKSNELLEKTPEPVPEIPEQTPEPIIKAVENQQESTLDSAVMLKSSGVPSTPNQQNIQVQQSDSAVNDNKVKSTAESETGDEDLDVPTVEHSTASQYVVLGIIGMIILVALVVYGFIKNRQRQIRRRTNAIGAAGGENGGNMMENTLI